MQTPQLPYTPPYMLAQACSVASETFEPYWV